MTDGDAVFSADGAHIGRISAFDDVSVEIRGDGHLFRVPRDKVAYERDGRVFLTLDNRNAARLWRVDVRRASGPRGWWERRVLGPSPRRLGGHLDD